MQRIWRLLIAAVVYTIVIFWLVPAAASLFGFPLSSALLLLIKGCAVLIAFYYVLWGPPVVPGPA